MCGKSEKKDVKLFLQLFNTERPINFQFGLQLNLAMAAAMAKTLQNSKI